MPVIKNTGADVNFAKVSLKAGANMVAPAHWDDLKHQPAVKHYLANGRLVVEGAQAKVQAEPVPPPQPEPEPAPQQQIDFAEMPAKTSTSSMKAADLIDLVFEMDEDGLDSLVESGEKRKTVLQAIEDRRNEIDKED